VREELVESGIINHGRQFGHATECTETGHNPRAVGVRMPTTEAIIRGTIHGFGVRREESDTLNRERRTHRERKSSGMSVHGFEGGGREIRGTRRNAYSSLSP
jgi:pseudouridine-5'-phosphate glycosidase